MRSIKWQYQVVSWFLIFSVGFLGISRMFQHECEVHWDHVSHLEESHSHDSFSDQVFVHDGRVHVEAVCDACDHDLILTCQSVPVFKTDPAIPEGTLICITYLCPATIRLAEDVSRGPPAEITLS
jgi:ABC-type nickel/cobalt efflux system permease component RcnA